MGLSKAQWKRAIFRELHANMSASLSVEDLFGEDVTVDLPPTELNLFYAAWQEIEVELLRRSK